MKKIGFIPSSEMMFPNTRGFFLLFGGDVSQAKQF